jgi:hypothetical protein
MYNVLVFDGSAICYAARRDTFGWQNSARTPAHDQPYIRISDHDIDRRSIGGDVYGFHPVRADCNEQTSQRRQRRPLRE